MPHLGPIVIGNTKLHEFFRAILKRLPNCRLTYSVPKQTLMYTFQNDSHDRDLPALEFDHISHETAKRIAQELGFNGDGELATTWQKLMPHAFMHDNKSLEANTLIADLVRCGIPFTICKGEVFGVGFFGRGHYKSPSHTLENMRQLIRSVEAEFHDALASLP